jgi:hypothetical protein
MNTVFQTKYFTKADEEFQQRIIKDDLLNQARILAMGDSLKTRYIYLRLRAEELCLIDTGSIPRYIEEAACTRFQQAAGECGTAPPELPLWQSFHDVMDDANIFFKMCKESTKEELMAGIIDYNLVNKLERYNDIGRRYKDLKQADVALKVLEGFFAVNVTRNRGSGLLCGPVSDSCISYIKKEKENKTRFIRPASFPSTTKDNRVNTSDSVGGYLEEDSPDGGYFDEIGSSVDSEGISLNADEFSPN